MSRRPRLSRRTFLQRAAAAGSAIAVPSFVPARVLGREGAPGANEEILIGFIGTGGRARQLRSSPPGPRRHCPSRFQPRPASPNLH